MRNSLVSLHTRERAMFTRRRAVRKCASQLHTHSNTLQRCLPVAIGFCAARARADSALTWPANPSSVRWLAADEAFLEWGAAGLVCRWPARTQPHSFPPILSGSKAKTSQSSAGRRLRKQAQKQCALKQCVCAKGVRVRVEAATVAPPGAPESNHF